VELDFLKTLPNKTNGDDYFYNTWKWLYDTEDKDGLTKNIYLIFLNAKDVFYKPYRSTAIGIYENELPIKTRYAKQTFVILREGVDDDEAKNRSSTFIKSLRKLLKVYGVNCHVLRKYQDILTPQNIIVEKVIEVSEKEN